MEGPADAAARTAADARRTATVVAHAESVERNGTAIWRTEVRQMKSLRSAVSYVIYNSGRSKFLIVMRPDDDPDLPNAWGLPAGNVRENESCEDAVRRALKQKLGVEGRATKFIGEGTTERKAYVLSMKLYEAEITLGEPKVPQDVESVTQYKDLRWGNVEDLREAASKGSLCCNLYLEYVRE